ncbi:aminopeptidase [Ramlibacter sp.]|uniref:aminopeptidase n=1 Tax=Ramlibacter sp. TaxID=1917967 RepID=UPI0018454048|nr:aminopeptidase [Ramlibacter sp.]MBA2674636.1 aminopeptidase [Ramlibacter sp.]
MRLGLIGTMAALAVTLSLGGCANLGYYLQSATGHLKLMAAAKQVPDWLGDPATPQRLKDKLALTQRIRDYAVAELKLPDNPSYRRYADLHRSAAVWNVVAAPAYSLTLKTWCFPVTGCVGYRGYFDEAQAREEAQALAQQGLESESYPVPAYSTLGLMNWAGGDPLLNTFIQYPEGELARLIFHELAHQVVYAKGDTMFNESFATAVERLGSARWLETQASQPARDEYAQFDSRRRQFRALNQATRERLSAIYDTPGLEPDERARRKAGAMGDFRAQYQQLRAGWSGDPARWRGYDRAVERANNASFGAQAAYDELVPGFEALFRREASDWQRFYAAARALAELSQEERHKRLKDGVHG